MEECTYAFSLGWVGLRQNGRACGPATAPALPHGHPSCWSHAPWPHVPMGPRNKARARERAGGLDGVPGVPPFARLTFGVGVQAESSPTHDPRGAFLSARRPS